MGHRKLIKEVGKYYSEKVQRFGTTAKGVDWKDEDSQRTRFDQLLKIINEPHDFTINDLGCGFGSMFLYMIETAFEKFQYSGFDISEEMITHARQMCNAYSNAGFIRISDSQELPVADFTVASGIFNVKMEYKEKEWFDYILATLTDMNNASRQGFSFNMLTSYHDKEFAKENLYYADPRFIFDYCKTHFSKYVSLLHDYPLYEFTILVRK